MRLDNNSLLPDLEKLGFGEIHLKLDLATELRALIVIHSTKRGPALGGCRCIEYSSFGNAIEDAVRLARGMSYKTAMANLPIGGGKAVLMRPRVIKDRTAYFQAFGQFVNNLGGRYITALDSGTVITDMDVISTQTNYVCTLSSHDGDPAPFTALGVLRGIEAAVKFKLQRDELVGLHVAIQGVGHTGYCLAELLYKRGAKITICDTNPLLTERCAKAFEANIVSSDAIYDVPCDVFAPCALGAVFNDQTISRLRATIIAGAANNQLAEPHHAMALQARNILYAPDYVINAGGLIHAYAEYNQFSMKYVEQAIENIYHTLFDLFERAKTENKTTSKIADTVAEEKLSLST